MISEDIIRRGGSKLEITRAALDSELKTYIPNSAWLYYSQDISLLRGSFNEMKKPVIVRGSHQNDYHGFIDVVPTFRDVHEWKDLEIAVNIIYSKMRSNAVKTHCEDWGQPYSPEVHILLQEQTTNIVGSMIRHPHEGTFRIQYYDLLGREDSNKENVSFALNYRDEKLRHFCSILGRGYDRVNISMEEITQVISMYERLEKSGIVDMRYSQQMEFGLRPLSFFQARPFKLFEETKDFEIPSFYGEKFPYFSTGDCFGITPPEGIDIKIIPLDGHGLNKWKINSSEEHGIILTRRLEETIPVSQTLGNLVFYGTECNIASYLMHSEYRQIKRAKFSFTGLGVHNVSHLIYIDPEELTDFKESRIYSNGNSGIIVPTKFL